MIEGKSLAEWAAASIAPARSAGVDFLGEQALAADIRERPILDPIASRPNDLKRDPLDLPADEPRPAAARLIRLRQAKSEPRVPSVNRGAVIGAT